MGAGASVEGGNASPALTPRVMVAMQAKTRLTPEELQLLGVHFQRYQLQDGPAAAISTDTVSLPTGSIDRVKFQQAMGLPEKESTYADRLFNLIDANHDGRISFEEFALSVSLLSTKATLHEKIKLSFDILDMDGDGQIAKGELATMLHITTTENNIKLTKDQVELIVNKTFVELGADGAITFDKYSNLVAANEGMASLQATV
ncbi:hypothetical protein, variant [Aphanomyces invadans]|uniref:EF-hand domain-containing protein n=1 Tax=Aphanomyces invadans TaxID=157072 RepID=A0A024UVB0_9STRA|nr:hypothetical protein, variant [Aphanomyces invadans]ETW09588.1 hypothetical protein, variant [Aphanomyces invadans]|eukprot:XP_008860999.1 hypothetical protein, variant [Aphanomyces invadans]